MANSASSNELHSITKHNNIVISGVGANEVLKFDGSNWINQTLAEAGIAPVATPTFTTSITIGSATVTEAQLEILDGAIVSTAELNFLAGVSGLAQSDFTKLAAVTVTAAEVNHLSSIASNVKVQIDAKAAVGSGTPSTQTIPDTAATGSSTEAARLDHVHTMPTAGGLRSTQFVPVRWASTNITLHSAVSSYGMTEHPNDSSVGNLTFSVMIPSDVTTLEKAVILVMTPDPSGNARLDFSASWGAIGEELTDTQTTISVANYPLTRWNHTEIDISGMLSGLAAGDILGVQMNKEGTHNDDTVGRLRTWGLVLEWS